MMSNFSVFPAGLTRFKRERKAPGARRRPLSFAEKRFLAVALAACVLPISAQAGVFSGHRPDGVGVGGRLAACPNKPNCVNSGSDDGRHAIAPLKFSGDAHAAMARLKSVVAAMPGANLIRQRPEYLYAEFRSRVMGFVDDVEFVLDERSGVIQVRSSSRLGYSDFGVNRRRIEAIRQKFDSAAGQGRRQ